MFETCSILRDSNHMIAYEILFNVTRSLAGFELFVGITYDCYFKDALQMLELSEDTLRRYLASLDPVLFTIYHPEFGYYKRTGHTSAVLKFTSDIHFFVLDNMEAYSLDIPLSIAIQLFLVVYLALIFTSLFFAFFNSSNKEEWAADVDYAISNLTVEAEKEIFAADDAVYLVLSMLFLFGVYFGLLALAYATSMSEASFFF